MPEESTLCPRNVREAAQKGTLRRIDLQACVPQDLENLAEVPHVFGEVSAGDKNVVQVDEHER
jgi:hypothetical protein